MGYLYGPTIQTGAEWLLRFLNGCGLRGSVLYSRFYDGSNATCDWLRSELGGEEDSQVDEAAEHVVDLAATQLEQQGLVTLHESPEMLADGHADYRITLTTKGRAWLQEPFALTFRDME